MSAQGSCANFSFRFGLLMHRFTSATTGSTPSTTKTSSPVLLLPALRAQETLKKLRKPILRRKAGLQHHRLALKNVWALVPCAKARYLHRGIAVLDKLVPSGLKKRRSCATAAACSGDTVRTHGVAVNR